MHSYIKDVNSEMPEGLYLFRTILNRQVICDFHGLHATKCLRWSDLHSSTTSLRSSDQWSAHAWFRKKYVRWSWLTPAVKLMPQKSACWMSEEKFKHMRIWLLGIDGKAFIYCNKKAIRYRSKWVEETKCFQKICLVAFFLSH